MSSLIRASLIALLLTVASSAAHAQPLITAFAGNETLEGCHNDNNVVATSTCLELISGLGIDGSGNILIAAGHGEAVYRVDQSGVITLLANGPNCCSAFDVAADLSGKVLVTAAHHIYRLETNGGKTIIAGTPDSPGYCGDGGPATSACLHMFDFGPQGADFLGGGLIVDQFGNIFVADVYNHAIRKIDAAGIITTVAGNGSPGFCPDHGAATGACLNMPRDVALDDAGNLYILDSVNQRIRKVDPSGVITSVLSGYDLAGLASDGEGNLFASDKNTDTVLRIDAQGAVAVYAGNGRHGSSGDGGLATAAKFNEPRRLAVDGDGKLYIADFFNQRVRKVDPMGSLWFKEKVGCQITGQVKLAAPAPPAGLTVSLASDHADLDVPPTVTVDPGKISKKFAVTVSPVATYEIARVTANFGSATRTTAFAVGPPHPLKVTFDPPTGTPGSTVTGIVTMNCPAAFDDVNVVITAAPSNGVGSFPPAATVPQGSSIATFPVTVELVARPKAPLRFTAIANTGGAIGTLTLRQQ